MDGVHYDVLDVPVFKFYSSNKNQMFEIKMEKRICLQEAKCPAEQKHKSVVMICEIQLEEPCCTFYGNGRS